MFYCNTSYLGVAGGEFAVVKTGLCDPQNPKTPYLRKPKLEKSIYKKIEILKFIIFIKNIQI